MTNNRLIICAVLLSLSVLLPGITLQQAFEESGPATVDSVFYDRHLQLETGAVYTGGLLIGPVLDGIDHQISGSEGLNVRIDGNGAILDLQGSRLCISYCNNRLDIQDCIILNGDVRFRGYIDPEISVVPQGSVRYCTFYKPHDYGIRLYGTGGGIELERNIVVDPVDTGWDFLYINGIPSDWLPTGTAISLSVQGQYGTPSVHDNWTWLSDPQQNDNLLLHYSLLCEYG